jgi:SAM-dependent methyltransferase
VRSKEVVPGVFSRHAAAYRDRLSDALARREAQGRSRVIERLAVQPGQRVLDLGCGPGTLTFPLAGAVGPDGFVLGVDLAEGMLAVARAQTPPNVGLARMDIERLGLRDGVFDAVACGHALQFCPDLERALAEARRVLRDGGHFAASVPETGRGGPDWRAVEDVLAPLLPPPPELPDSDDTRATMRDEERLRSALLKAGFRDGAVVTVEEVSRYAGPADLIDKTMSWWSCAWRLEALSPAERARVRAKALLALQELIGERPAELSGTSRVLSARA